MCFISEILFFPSLLKAHQISTIDRPPRKLHELLSLDEFATCSGTFSWPQIEDSTVYTFQVKSVFFPPLQCLDELRCSHFYFKFKAFNDWGKQETPTHFAHFFSIVLNYYQPMFVQRTCDKRWPIVNSPRPETQGSHTALCPHSIWRKVRRKCLEETVKGIETKTFGVDQAFWIWWTSKLSSEKRSHLHKKLTLTISSPSIFKSEINTPGTSSIFAFHLNKPTRSTVNNEKLVEHMLIKKVNFIGTG